MQLPKDALAPKDAAQKYGLSWAALRKAIERGRIQRIKYGSRWYITEREIKKYLHSRYYQTSPKKK